MGLANQEVLPIEQQGQQSAQGGREIEGGGRGAKRRTRSRSLAGGGGNRNKGSSRNDDGSCTGAASELNRRFKA